MVGLTGDEVIVVLKGWKMIAVTPGQGGAASQQDWLAVAIPNRDDAIRAVKARFPDAEVRIDSEADSDYLAKYGVIDGQVLVLVEGS